MDRFTAPTSARNDSGGTFFNRPVKPENDIFYE